MGSLGAMQQGSNDRYFQEETRRSSKLVPEGIEGKVPYKGSVAPMVPQLVGGLRSGMGLAGCAGIEELRDEGAASSASPPPAFARATPTTW